MYTGIHVTIRVIIVRF